MGTGLADTWGRRVGPRTQAEPSAAPGDGGGSQGERGHAWLKRSAPLPLRTSCWRGTMSITMGGAPCPHSPWIVLEGFSNLSRCA